jgi:hypothetical protein
MELFNEEENQLEVVKFLDKVKGCIRPEGRYQPLDSKWCNDIPRLLIEIRLKL